VIYTRPPNFPAMGIESDGHVHSDVKELAGSAIQQTGGHVHAYDDAGNALAVSSKQPDNKPTVDASGHTEAIAPDGSDFNDLSQAQANAACDSALSDAGVTSARMDYVDNLDGHTAQTGDSYAIVNSVTYGNSALKDLIDTVDGVVDAIKTNTDDLADGARLDLLIDAIKAKTDALKDSWNDLGASDVRGAVGLASANLDTQLSALNGYVDCLPATLDGATFTNLPAVTTDAASREASKADLSDLPTNAEFEARTIVAAQYATASGQESVKLASDGLDSVAPPAPSGAPSGWSFAQKLYWLILTSWNSVVSGGVWTTKDESGTAVSEQTVSDSDLDETRGAPTEP
jgi:hypothetical protein